MIISAPTFTAFGPTYNFPSALLLAEFIQETTQNLINQGRTSHFIGIYWNDLSSHIKNTPFTIVELEVHPSASDKITSLFDNTDTTSFQAESRQLIYAMLTSSTTLETPLQQINENELSTYIVENLTPDQRKVYAWQLRNLLSICLSKKLICKKLKPKIADTWLVYFKDQTCASEQFQYIAKWHDYLKECVPIDDPRDSNKLGFLPYLRSPDFPPLPFTPASYLFSVEKSYELLSFPIDTMRFTSALNRLYQAFYQSTGIEKSPDNLIKLCIAPHMSLSTDDNTIKLELAYIEHIQLRQMLESTSKKQIQENVTNWFWPYFIIKQGNFSPPNKLLQAPYSLNVQIALSKAPLTELDNLNDRAKLLFGFALAYKTFQLLCLHDTSTIASTMEQLTLFIDTRMTPSCNQTISNLDALQKNNDSPFKLLSLLALLDKIKQSKQRQIQKASAIKLVLKPKQKPTNTRYTPVHHMPLPLPSTTSTSHASTTHTQSTSKFLRQHFQIHTPNTYTNTTLKAKKRQTTSRNTDKQIENEKDKASSVDPDLFPKRKRRKLTDQSTSTSVKPSEIQTSLTISIPIDRQLGRFAPKGLLPTEEVSNQYHHLINAPSRQPIIREQDPKSTETEDSSSNTTSVESSTSTLFDKEQDPESTDTEDNSSKKTSVESSTSTLFDKEQDSESTDVEDDSSKKTSVESSTSTLFDKEQDSESTDVEDDSSKTISVESPASTTFDHEQNTDQLPELFSPEDIPIIRFAPPPQLEDISWLQDEELIRQISFNPSFTFGNILSDSKTQAYKNRR